MPCTCTVLVSIRWDCRWSVALELHAILVGNVADWSIHIMGSFQVSKYIKYSAYTGCISLYIYCLITCNIKSLLNVPKISHISRKNSQVSRFPAKSPNSRNKFVFLPKQPLLELSAPVTGKPSHKQNLLKTSKTVETYNKCPVLKDLHFN